MFATIRLPCPLAALSFLLFAAPPPAVGQPSASIYDDAMSEVISEITETSGGILSIPKRVAFQQAIQQKGELAKSILPDLFVPPAIIESHEGKEANLVVEAGGLRTGNTSQPTEPLVILLGAPPGQQAPGVRAYVLNIARSNLNSSGQAVDGPMTVDFQRPADLSYDARVDIEEGIGSTASFDPQDMAITRDGTLLVVAARGSDTLSDPRTPIPPHLTLIDTASAQVLRHVNLPAQFLLHSLALAPDGIFAFVAASELDQSQSGGVPPAVANTLLVVDLRSNAVVERIDLPPPVASAMGETVITPDGALLFVKGPAGVSIIDTGSRTITATIAGFSTAARHLAMHPHGTKVYISDVSMPASTENPSLWGIAVIDVATAIITDRIRIPNAQGGSRQDLGITGNGRVLSHIDSLSGTWTLINAVTYETIRQIDLGESVFRGAIARWP